MATAAPVRPGRDAAGNKLPIYPRPEPVVTLIETESPLTPYIAQARIATQSAFAGAGDYVEGGVSKWVGFERRVEREVQSILPADEPLTPGAIYVLISGLTGSVLTRTRSLPIRFLAPPLFALAAAPYFLPKTSHNIRSYLSRVEDAHMPELAASHDRLNAQVASTWNQVRGQVGGASETAKGWGERAARGVEDATGLKVASVQGEVMRRVDEAKAKAKEIREQGLPREGERLERVGVVVEQRPVAEIVAPVGAGLKGDVSAAAAAAAAAAVKEQPKTRLV